MSSYNAFFGQITLDDDNESIIVGAVTLDMDKGDYYIYSPVAAESLLDVLCAKISEESTAAVTFSISASGILTLSSTSSFSLEFDSTLYLTLGFASAAMSGATSYTATSKLQYCWFPEQLDSGHLAPTSSAGKKYPVVSQQQAADKTVWTTKYGEVVKQELTYRYLSKAKCWTASTAENSSWEEFFSTTYSQGRKFVFIPWWSGDESDYWYYVADLKAEPSPTVIESITGSDSYWDLTMYLLEVDA